MEAELVLTICFQGLALERKVKKKLLLKLLSSILKIRIYSLAALNVSRLSISIPPNLGSCLPCTMERWPFVISKLIPLLKPLKFVIYLVTKRLILQYFLLIFFSPHCQVYCKKELDCLWVGWFGNSCLQLQHPGTCNSILCPFRLHSFPGCSSNSSFPAFLLRWHDHQVVGLGARLETSCHFWRTHSLRHGPCVQSERFQCFCFRFPWQDH